MNDNNTTPAMKEVESDVLSALYALPFSEIHISNQELHPSEEDLKWMPHDKYDEAINNYLEAQKKVVFKDLHVNMETCDCGGEYGCSHGSYPYDIRSNFDKVDMTWEDGGFYIENKIGFIRFDKTSQMTIGHFYQACLLLDIPIEFGAQWREENPVKGEEPQPTTSPEQILNFFSCSKVFDEITYASVIEAMEAYHAQFLPPTPKQDKEIEILKKECLALRECLVKVSTLSTKHFPITENPVTELIWKYRPTIHPDVRTDI